MFDAAWQGAAGQGGAGLGGARQGLFNLFLSLYRGVLRGG